jgi:hypothetical protein
MGAEIPDGCVLVARAILNSSLWTMRAEDRLVAITCICLANWRPRSWFNGESNMTIDRGQFVRSWQQLAEECNLSTKTVRTSVKNLENCGFLARKRAGHVQLFCIPKYEHYQDLTKYSDSIPLKTGKEAGSYRAGNGQDPGSKLATNNKGIMEEGKKGEEMPPTKSSPTGLLMDLAKNAHLIYSSERQLRIAVEGWMAQRGFEAVQTLLMSGIVNGWDVMQVTKVHFNGETKQIERERDAAFPKL